jgi:hypothetical protein
MLAQQKPISSKLRNKLLVLINRLGVRSLNDLILNQKINKKFYKYVFDIHVNANDISETLVNNLYTNIKQFYAKHGLNITLNSSDIATLIGLRAGTYATLKLIKQKVLFDENYAQIKPSSDVTIDSFIESAITTKDYNISYFLLYLDYTPDDLLNLLLDGINILTKADKYDSDYNFATVTMILYISMIVKTIRDSYSRLVRSSPLYGTILYLSFMIRYYVILLDLRNNLKNIMTKISDTEIEGTTLKKYKQIKQDYLRFLIQPTKIYPSSM